MTDPNIPPPPLASQEAIGCVAPGTVVKMDNKRIFAQRPWDGKEAEYDALIPAAREFFRQAGVDSSRLGRRLKSPSELLEAGNRKVEWLVDGLIPAAGIVMLAGPSGVGKTELAANLGHAVATGGLFLGRTTRCAPVLHVSVEEYDGQVGRRIARLGLSDHHPFYARTLSDPFAENEELKWLAEQAEIVKPGLVILDTIVPFLRIEDSTNYGIVKAKTRALLELRSRLGFAFLWLHHTNRFKKVFGAATWESIPDVIFLYTAAEDERRIIKTTKGREDVKLPATMLNYDSMTGIVDMEGSKHDRNLAKAEQAILASGEFGTRERLSRYGSTSKVGRRAVDNLVASGLLVPTQAGRLVIYSQPGSTPPSLSLVEQEPISSKDTTIAEAPRTYPEDTTGAPSHPELPEDPEAPQVNYCQGCGIEIFHKGYCGLCAPGQAPVIPSA